MTIICKECHRPFEGKTLGRKYCDDCKRIRSRRYIRNWQREHRERKKELSKRYTDKKVRFTYYADPDVAAMIHEQCKDYAISKNELIDRAVRQCFLALSNGS